MFQYKYLDLGMVIIIIIIIYSESYPAGISLHNILISIVNAKEQC